MSAVSSPKWYHANKYAADAACAVCGGVVRHAFWCAESNAAVAYAYEVLRDSGKLTVEDQLILHALGVVWV